eukprot:Gb_14306 [translate_table: standard]
MFEVDQSCPVLIEGFVGSWPSKPAAYREVASRYSSEVRGLVLQLLAAISETLGLEPDFLDKALGQHGQHMAINYYPQCPDPELTFGLPPHSDPNVITVLLQDEVSGLQVLENQQWIAVHPIARVCELLHRNVYQCRLLGNIRGTLSVESQGVEKKLGGEKKNGVFFSLDMRGAVWVFVVNGGELRTHGGRWSLLQYIALNSVFKLMETMLTMHFVLSGAISIFLLMEQLLLMFFIGSTPVLVDVSPFLCAYSTSRVASLPFSTLPWPPLPQCNFPYSLAVGHFPIYNLPAGFPHGNVHVLLVVMVQNHPCLGPMWTMSSLHLPHDLAHAMPPSFKVPSQPLHHLPTNAK